MLRSTENHKHVRRRLEPLRIAVKTVGAATVSRANGPGVCVSVVEALGTQYRGRMIVDAGMDWSCGGKKPYLANRFVEECVRLSQLRHPNLTMLYGIVVDGPSLTLVTDLPEASLDECLCRYEAIPDFMKTSILLDAARGLLYLHKQKPAIAHTGVSTRSVYVLSSMRAKIGDVGVAGALSESAANDVARTSNERLPPKTFVKILEIGTKCTDTQVDIPAFGNVIVHTVCQQRWLDPPGHTAVSPYLHTVPGHHPLYSLAYHCLQGSVQFNSQLGPMEYVVQCLQYTAKNNPPPFHNTLELFQTLVKVERSVKRLHSSSPTPPHQLSVVVQDPPLHNSDTPLPGHKISQKCNHLDQSSNTSRFPTSGTGSSNTPPSIISSSPTKATQDISHSDYNGLPTASEDHCSSRRNSTGQARAPPPKPPQRSSSFRRKSSEQVTTQKNQDSLQRAGSFRQKRIPPVEPSVTSLSQQQVSPIIKTVGVFSGGPVKQNSMILPSKFSPLPHKEDVKQNPRSHRSAQDGDCTSIPASVQTSLPKCVPSNLSNTSEFERLLARQREKVESDQLKAMSWLQPPPPSINGAVMHRSTSFGIKAATDMDLPKKKAPKPPRRTSSFKSHQKPTKYEGCCNHTPETTRNSFRRHLTTPPGRLADRLSPSSTSPSTGQSLIN